MQQGIHASRTIKRRLEGEDSAPFRYRDLGSMATVSRFRAVVSFKGIRVAGFLGWLMWLFVHLAFMTGFRNRFTTILGWTLSFLGKGRSQRTLTFQQVVGRVAIEEAGGRPFLMSLTSEKPDRGRDPHLASGRAGARRAGGSAIQSPLNREGARGSDHHHQHVHAQHPEGAEGGPELADPTRNAEVGGGWDRGHRHRHPHRRAGTSLERQHARRYRRPARPRSSRG